MTRHHHLLILQLLGNVAWARARDFNPSLREKSTCGEHKGDVDGGVDRIENGFLDGVRRRHVVGHSRGSAKLRRILQRLPDTKEFDEDILGEPGGQHLGNDEDIGGKGGLEHDGHVRGVEKLDGESATLTTEARALDRDFNAEALEVDDDGKDNDSRDEVHDVGKTITPESLAEGAALIVPGEEEVEKSDNGAFELGAATNVDGGGGEGLPHDGLANVGSDEQVDAGAQAVALLEELIEKDDNEGGDYELNDEEQADASTEVFGLAIETGKDVDGGLAKSNNDSKD